MTVKPEAAPQRHYVTAAIPYVNARPHIGYALELVQADAIARHLRRRGRQVRLLTGTDDNAPKNVVAAAAAGRDVTDFVADNAAAFRALQEPLGLAVDDFISTSSDPRHRRGVEYLWRACAASGDLYEADYEGTYCTGCEQFYDAAELVEGRCGEHGDSVEVVRERNWFFALSRYAEAIGGRIRSGQIRVEPVQRRNEILAVIDAGVGDISVSRDADRSHGWGIPVPDDPTQVIYVWWDALCNYVTALDVGGDQTAFGYWWEASQHRTHVIGKGILRFHALYWPAILLSAGQVLPTRVFVHDYLTADGAKISKTSGNTVDPVAITWRYGTDALRWWFLSDVARVGDTDFSATRLVDRWNAAFPNGIGNVLARVATLVVRHRPEGLRPACPDPVTARLDRHVSLLPDKVAAAVDEFHLRAATATIEEVTTAANQLLETTEPWKLAHNDDTDAQRRFDAVCASVTAAVQAVTDELIAFAPGASRTLSVALAHGKGRSPLFDRLSL